MILRFYKKIFLLILLCFLSAAALGGFFVSAGLAMAPAVSPLGEPMTHEPDLKEPPRAMWVWDVKIFQDEEAANRLLNFCKAQNVNTLFYTAYKVTGNNIIDDYKRFNKQAHQRGILVQALAGDPRWALEKYHHRFLEWANDIAKFNNTALPQERFDGIHADVEPYLMTKLWESDNKAILAQYLDANKKVKEFLKLNAQGVVFAIDVPFWYDDDTEMWLEWQNKFAPANYHALDIVDQMAIMDYRNFARGENGSILLAKNEINYAASVFKKAYIGQETGKNLQPDYITFGGTNADYMENEIKKLLGVYINNPGFAGIAIHHYISYKRLLKESGKAVE